MSDAAGILAHDRRGVTAVEFALLLPFFVILLFGIIEFGQALFLQAALQHAVTEAARCATISGAPGSTPDCSSADKVATYAASEAYGLAVASGVFSTSAPAGFNCVAASYPFTLSIPLLPALAVTLSAKSCYPA
ncbi:MAG TPA: TadE/TadG family type IV pilus assembly protein [Stellaceae bacterium]|nr:TadE/TadG family type IV pilus assembly protein [Stellaceae bacterium]